MRPRPATGRNATSPQRFTHATTGAGNKQSGCQSYRYNNSKPGCDVLRGISLFCLWLGLSTAMAAGNSLLNDPSPYLAMHGEDPVHWQHWDEQAIRQAREQNKLLFVSIGYFSCHWCHVMQRESYRNPEIAALLNQHFISVKVDRELNPALDARLIEFVERTRGYSGWPLNVFITPEGYPLLGLVYLPPADFKNLLGELQGLWQKDAASLRRDAQAAARELAPKPWPRGRTLAAGFVDRVLPAFNANLLLHADRFAGGFGEQNKFPNAPQLAALLESQARRPDPALEKFLNTTLQHMQQYGLRDHLGGGFFRYTVDPQWRVPHFEKMLYDNAQLARLYMRAAEVLKNPDYIAVAAETLDFMQQRLGTAQGGLAASLSAIDAQNVEGGYYLWSEQELRNSLSAEDFAFVQEHWGMAGGSTTEDGYLPIAATSLAFMANARKLPVAQLQAQRARIYRQLQALREKRALPRDGKQLAAWNALALLAFTDAAATGDRPAWRKTAQGIRDYLARQLWDGKQLYRARTAQGTALGVATLEDYAYSAAALRRWSEVSGNAADRELARQLVQQGWQRFFNEHGFRRTEHDLLAIGEGETWLTDSPLPSASAVLIGETLALFEAGQPLRQQAEEVLAAGSDWLEQDPFWFASQMQVLLRQPAAGGRAAPRK